MEDKTIKISFTILTHNEDESLKKLLTQLFGHVTVFDEIIIVDDYSTNPKTIEILEWAKTQFVGCRVFQNKLEKNFSAQKNFAASNCTNPYIFNVDSDELLDENLLKTYKDIISTNSEVELFFLPRVNTVEGLTLQHITQWRWQISGLRSIIVEEPLQYESNKYKLLKSFNLIINDNNNVITYYEPIINWPDWQGRIYKNSDKIRWINPVHEVITGHMKFARFPLIEKFSIRHPKTIEKQEIQNSLYQNI